MKFLICKLFILKNIQRRRIKNFSGWLYDYLIEILVEIKFKFFSWSINILKYMIDIPNFSKMLKHELLPEMLYKSKDYLKKCLEILKGCFI